MYAADLVHAMLGGCHAMLGVNGTPKEIVINGIDIHNREMAFRGRSADGQERQFSCLVNSPVSEQCDSWVITAESGDTFTIPHYRC